VAARKRGEIEHSRGVNHHLHRRYFVSSFPPFGDIVYPKVRSPGKEVHILPRVDRVLREPGHDRIGMQRWPQETDK
jgi:hypothetical protein